MKQKKLTINYKLTPKRGKGERQEFEVSIRIPMKLGWIDNVEFVLLGEESKPIRYKKKDEEYAYFDSVFDIEQRAIYHYCFAFNVQGVKHYYKKINKTGDFNVSIEECWKLSVLFKVPEWPKGKVMYHIFVDCFYRSETVQVEEMKRRHIHKNWNETQVLGPDEEGIWNNWFYCGNLNGIKEKLDYIKSLGVSIIYVSPIFYSQSNHGYDTGDYRRIDPYKGSNYDFEELCKEIHKRGMYLVIDGVFNHTGNDSIYYNQYGTFDTIGVYQSTESPYYNFYKRGKNGELSFWWGYKNMIKCDSDGKEWQDYIYGPDGVIPYWIRKGADGVRYDVADELTDKFLGGCRKAARKINPNTFLYLEVWYNPMRMERDYISSGKCADSSMNYLFADALIGYFKESDVDNLKNVCWQILVEYPEDTILTLMNFSSTHDISRIIDIFGIEDKFKSKYETREWRWDLKISEDRMSNYRLSCEEYKRGKMITQAYLFALTFWPGIVSIFYGDEVCAQGLGNLANRCPFPWDSMDKEMLKFVKKVVGEMRKRYKFLERAHTNVIRIDGEHFVYERYYDTGRKSILIVVSRSNEETHFTVPKKYRKAKVIASLRAERRTLGPYGAIAFRR